MKRTILLMAMALMVGVAFAQSNAFAKLADIKGMEHVVINKTMLNLAAKSGGDFDFGDDLSLEGMSGDMLKKLENISIYNCEEEDGVEAMSKQVASILNGRGWEPLVVGTDEDGEKMKISQFKKGKKSTIAIFHEEEGESSLIILEGKMDFKKMIEKQVEIYTKKLNKELKELNYGFGAAIGYSSIKDGMKTIDDAINEATLEMRTNKEDYK